MSEQTLTRAAVVTGGSRGIGRAVCTALAKQGVNVVVNYCHGEAAAAETVALCKAAGADAVAVQADVSTAAGCKALFDAAAAAFGRVDILVNNAGTGGQPKKMVDMDEEYFDHYVQADYKALYFMSQAVARQMAEQGCEKGTHPYRIINLSSAAGIKSPIGDTVYGSLKAAVTHLSRIMANELARYGVTVNAVAPGYVLTDMTKDVMADEKNVAAVTRMISLRRYAQPEEIAGVINFLASPAGGYITGQLIPVDGGMTIN